MHDASAMCCTQAVSDLDRVLNSDLDGKRALFETMIERLALQQLEHQKFHTRIVVSIVELTDMRMVEGCDRARFALESLTSIWIGKCRRQDFERNVAV